MWVGYFLQSRHCVVIEYLITHALPTVRSDSANYSLKKKDGKKGARQENLWLQRATDECVTALYDDIAHQYDKEAVRTAYCAPSELAKSFSEVCQDRNAEIIDWGAGTGLVGEELTKYGFTNLSAVDVSQKSLDVAEEKGAYKKIIKLGNSKEIFNDDEYDAIVCVGCIVPNHVKPDIFYEWVRIVKSGGIIAILTRQACIELVQGKEHQLSEELKMNFAKVVEDLKNKKQWVLVSSRVVSNYGESTTGVQYIFQVV